MQADVVPVQDLRPHRRDLPLQRGAWPLGGFPRRPVGRRRRQLRTVELSVSGEGQLGQRDEGGRNHVRGQCPAEPGTQFGHRGRPCGVAGDDIGHQAALPGYVLAREDHRLPYRGVIAQRRLDLSQFDTVAADLHLVVGAAEVFQQAVRPPAGQVTGPVHPFARTGVRVGKETFGSKLRAAQVTAREPGTGHVQLSRHPGRHLAETGVQDVEAVRAHRPPDRREPAHGDLGGPVRRPHGGLRGPVAVEDTCLGEDVQNLLDQCSGKGLADVDHGGGAGRQPALRREHRHRRRRPADQRRPVGPRVAFGEREDVPHDLHPAAAGQGREQFEDRGVEGERGGAQDTRQLSRTELGHGPAHQVDRGRVRHDDALGLPRGPGGVQHVRRMGGGRVGLRGLRLAPVVRRGQVPVGEHTDRPGVPQHELDALRRVGRVQRKVRAAGLEHGQEGDDGLHRAW